MHFILDYATNVSAGLAVGLAAIGPGMGQGNVAGYAVAPLAVFFLTIFAIICFLILLLQLKRDKQESNSMDSYKSIDELFETTKQNLESWAEGDLELSDQEVSESVKTYLTYLPPTAGLSFLVELNLSYDLSNKSRKIIYNLVLKHIQKLAPNLVQRALQVLCEELDTSVLSVKYLDPSLLYEFVSFIKDILYLNSCTVSPQVVDIWTESIRQADSFTWVTKETRVLLKQAINRPSITMLLTRIAGFFLLMGLCFLIASSLSN